MSEADDETSFGWFAYAPLSGSVFVPWRRRTGDLAPAVARAPHHTVRLMNEYGARWPVWTHFDSQADAAVDAAVDDELEARLRAWADVFNEHYDDEHGWDDPRVATAHRAEGKVLRDALAAVLPEPWRVELDYWETNGA